MKLDTFFVQLLSLIRRRFAIDRTVFDLAIMHLARFFRKLPADIVGIFHKVLAQFLELLAQLPSCGDIIATGARAACVAAVAAAGAVAGVLTSVVATEASAGFRAVAIRGAMMAFSTLVELHTGQMTKPRLACLS